MEIYELAKNGGLKEEDLKHLDSRKLNYFNTDDQLTPLGVAVFKRNLKAAQLLLKHGYDPNGLGKGRPPLWVACGRRKSQTNVEERLIQLLLSKNAGANLRSQVKDDEGSTPLMKAVETRKSTDVLSSLVDHGADPDADVGGSSPRKLAEKQNRLDALNAMLPRSKRISKRVLEVAKVTGFVLSAVYWANKNLKVAASAAAGTAVVVGAGYFLKDAIKKRFGWTGKVDEGMKKYIKEEELFSDAKAEEKRQLKKRMNKIIEDKGLNRFFPKDNPFLEKVVDRAVNLNRDPTNTLDPNDLTHLALYQPILYCDDSGSMKDDQRKDRLNDLAQRITSITTRVVPDNEGIELRFINAKTTGQMSKPKVEEINTIMEKIPFDGWTEIGTNLKKKVLQDYVYKHLDAGTLQRPVLVSIITDGQPNGDRNSKETTETLQRVIAECGRTLEYHGYKRDVVRFQVSQIGDDPEAEKFLNKLQDDLDLKDTLYITSDRLDEKFKDLHENQAKLEQWLLRILMEPIVDAQSL
ncbi:hypothetical protein BDV32DRAFT_131471 [Aspergillus pseudonomiae]|uniref:Uncharacterized protein n=1 Tax=Aspergillus pseudonomiae TaxID=1506151 RepID=A0A5N7DSL6_9EURO|nr:uncharacterized protein BDV37DRAFT_293898 [Aspergillus pseudonomiae]KAB8254988.1 hypothetical protein BDV32DRAFT_131471 [Aspergillus pseudonomiae]KAE8409376.1 hypothetical protein BDV37DRAFT_293898 [Aspergillus pseudonomiae]